MPSRPLAKSPVREVGLVPRLATVAALAGAANPSRTAPINKALRIGFPFEGGFAARIGCHSALPLTRVTACDIGSPASNAGGFMSKHTPGPWTTNRSAHGGYSV